MQIDKGSWHYKFWEFTFGSNPLPYGTNLCRYTQRIFWHGLLYLGMILGLGFMAGMALYWVFLIFYHHTLIALIVTAALAVLVGIGFLIWWWRQTMKHEEPGIVGQWLAAKKEGICPLIEFTDLPEPPNGDKE